MSYDRDSDLDRQPPQTEKTAERSDTDRPAGTAPVRDGTDGRQPGVATPEATANAEELTVADLFANAESTGGPEPRRVGAAELPDVVRNVVDSQGESLDQSTQEALAKRVGDSFRDVAVHTGEQAAEAAQALGALGFTLGTDIVLNRRALAPDSLAEKGLIARQLREVSDRADEAAVFPGDGRGSSASKE